jgi:hypothetical protein
MAEMNVDPKEVAITRNEYRVLIGRVAEIANEDAEDEAE